MFVTSDLFQKKGIPQVVQNVYSVIRLAQSNPDWTGPTLGPVTRPVPKAKKWEEVRANTEPITVDQLESAQIQADSHFQEEHKLRLELENELRGIKLKLELETRERQQVSSFFGFTNMT